MTEHHHRLGVTYAVAAFCMWGFFPLYFKLLAHLAPIEVLAWRCVWSFATLALVLTILKHWHRFVQCFRSPKTFGKLVLSMTMIVSNWGLFVYAVTSNQVLQSSLAYFINPLFSVLLGVVFLHERLRLLQVISIGLATVGVLTMTFLASGFPHLAIALAMSFGIYGYLRKTVKGVDGLTGLSVETALATPLALMMILYLQQHGSIGAETAPAVMGPSDHVLLSLTGALTMMPLLLFIGAARCLPLSTVGMLQYITPTLHFASAVFLFGEPFSLRQLVSFCFIWVAVTLFLIDSRRTRPTPPI